jgi:hypothetical protein
MLYYDIGSPKYLNKEEEERSLDNERTFQESISNGDLFRQNALAESKMNRHN